MKKETWKTIIQVMAIGCWQKNRAHASGPDL